MLKVRRPASIETWAKAAEDIKLFPKLLHSGEGGLVSAEVGQSDRMRRVKWGRILAETFPDRVMYEGESNGNSAGADCPRIVDSRRGLAVGVDRDVVRHMHFKVRLRPLAD